MFSRQYGAEMSCSWFTSLLRHVQTVFLHTLAALSAGETFHPTLCQRSSYAGVSVNKDSGS
jgi:hypothetical protein